jgi:hypothetical protein
VFRREKQLNFEIQFINYSIIKIKQREKEQEEEQRRKQNSEGKAILI